MHRNFSIFLCQSEQQKITNGGCMEEPNDFFTKTFIVNDKVKERGCMLAVTKKIGLKYVMDQ